jgi:cytochrome P450
VAISRDTGTFSSRQGVITLDDLAPDQLDARRSMLEEDPPRHREMRGLVAQHFTPKAVRAHEQFVRALAARVIEDALGQDRIDLVAALSEQVPIRVLARILGVPDPRVADLVRLGNLMIGSDDPEYAGPILRALTEGDLRLLPFGNPAALDAFEMARELGAQRRVNPVDDVMTALAHGELDGRALTDEELGTFFVLLVIAGNETTRHSITAGIAELAANEEQWGLLRRGEADPMRAADEVLRWATAIHFHRRVATRPITFGDVDIEMGEKVALYFASANFDESVFEDPYRFDLNRSPNDHVAFGKGGPHFCLGAHLARLEVRVVLEELAARVGSIQLLGEPERLRSNHINGVKHLLVRFLPA